MRTIRFHELGAPLDVLRIDEVEAPEPGPGQIRVAVDACGLTPADWALCRGLFPGDLPRGIGLEVSGDVEALGEGVTGIGVGDPVVGPVPFTGATAGASGFALLDVWFPRPASLDAVHAAALPMAVETAYRGLDELGIREGATVLVHGAGSTIGYAAVGIALDRGAHVIAAAGETYAEALRNAGAQVTPYGAGIADRVRAIAAGPVDLVFDAAPRGGSLEELVRTVTDPANVLTVGGDVPSAGALGARVSLGEGATLRTDMIGHYADLAGQGRFSIPVARVLPLDDWRTAVELSESGHARGKLVLLIADDAR